jgi:hypothetical protein
MLIVAEAKTERIENREERERERESHLLLEGASISQKSSFACIVKERPHLLKVILNGRSG